MKKSAAVFFLGAFLTLLTVTFEVPSLPPADILMNLIGLPDVPFSIGGISGETLVYGVLNGVFWALFLLMIYYWSLRVSKTKVPPSVAIPPPPILITSTPLTPSQVSTSPTENIRQTPISLLQPIEAIEGIGPTYGGRLRNLGVNVVEDLLAAGSTRNGRRGLARKVGVTPKTIRMWVRRADFFCIRVIGRQYSSLLQSAGVNTVVDLARRNPVNLYTKLRETNREKNLVRRIPYCKMIEGWIENAKELAPIEET